MATTTTMSGAAFDQLPYEEGRRLELLHGEVIGGEQIDMAGPTWEHQTIVLDLGANLLQYLRQEDIGGVAPDVEFALGADDRLRPDLAIVMGERWRSMNSKKSPVPFAPAIAVEVVSPSERTEDSLRKIEVYLAAGVQEVWQLSAKTKRVYIYRAESQVIRLSVSDRLTSPLLPGWEMPVSELFSAS